MKQLMLVGATGLVGSHVLQKALDDAAVARVVAPTRKPLAPHPKLLNPVVDFWRLPEDADWWAVDAVICTLGTTIRAAGSQTAFYKVDHDHPLEVAYLARRHGARAYAFNSALGADARSRVFYSRTKGETERDLQAVGYPSLTLVRPGLIGGRRQQSRPMEQLAVGVSKLVQPLLPRRYRVVPAERIAHHLLQAALTATPGVHVLPSEVLI
ncbi:NAD-dependent dehydratase [Hydrogenophaga sp. 2FB]|uniref:NAD-dependent dehydratase n=1 Tax=Hydrogenophaga sp. 2FB TaxID=2502187 RepID=UPI0010F4469F|nr:NAD-dependent dehydratase [Hydrogenophaga sp. 2FB]